MMVVRAGNFQDCEILDHSIKKTTSMNRQIINGTKRFEHSLCAYQFQNRISKLVANLLVLASGLLMLTTSAFGQDSLVFKNNNYMTGEIKAMSKGVLSIETDYSKSDFTIEWVDIKEIYTKTNFTLTQTDGDRLSGTLQSLNPTQVNVVSDKGTSTSELNNIVQLKSVSEKFWDRFHAAISLGLSVTRAQSLKQFTSRSSVGYVREKWTLDATFNSLRSTQDEVEDIRRKDGGLTFTYLLPKDWYIPASISFLSNTEQKLDLRLLEKVGIGKYVIHTNQAYWGFSLGANYNAESFTDDTPDRQSWEGFIGTQANLFDTGDLSLFTNLVVYPSFTESGRVRSDFQFDAKYEFPYDFFLQLGFTLNYDNQPVSEAPDTDYVFQTTFGWSW
jgi:hypothetical protein